MTGAAQRRNIPANARQGLPLQNFSWVLRDHQFCSVDAPSAVAVSLFLTFQF